MVRPPTPLWLTTVWTMQRRPSASSSNSWKETPRTLSLRGTGRDRACYFNINPSPACHFTPSPSLISPPPLNFCSNHFSSLSPFLILMFPSFLREFFSFFTPRLDFSSFSLAAYKSPFQKSMLRTRIRKNPQWFFQLNLDPGWQKWPTKKNSFWSAGCSLLRTRGFFCRLDVLHGSLWINVSQFLI